MGMNDSAGESLLPSNCTRTELSPSFALRGGIDPIQIIIEKEAMSEGGRETNDTLQDSDDQGASR